MLRLALFAVALAGMVATAQPSFAGSSDATTSDRAQAAEVAAKEQAASPAPAWSSSLSSSPSDAPVGFGWG
jgi:hypothetical protein